MIIPVLDVHRQGMAPDIPPHRSEALTLAKNVRFDVFGTFTGGGVGSVAVTGITEDIIDIFVLPDGDAVLCGLTGIYRWTGSAVQSIGHKIFAGQIEDRWTGGFFNNFLVMTNGKDAPVYYDYYAGSTTADVPGWLSGRVALRIRPLVYHLVVLGAIVGSVPDYRRVWWSSAAEPGTMPASWDVASYTNDAGEVTLANGSDPIVDGLQLGTSFIVYTREQTWQMRYVGGVEVFAFSLMTNQSGLMAPGAVVHLQGIGHFVVSGNDIVIVGDGVQSIATGRVRRWLLDNLDSVSYHSTRVLHLPYSKEVFVFFPPKGEGYPRMAAVWKYDMNVWSFLEWDRPLKCLGYKGRTVYSEVYTIDSNNVQCDSSDGVLCDDVPATYELGEKLLFCVNKSDIAYYDPKAQSEASIERQGLAYVAPGEVDELVFKRALGVRLDVEGPPGAVVTIDYGAKMSHSGSVQWLGSVDYVIGTTEEAQFEAVGRFIAIRFRWTSPDIVLRGFYYDVHSLGEAF